MNETSHCVQWQVPPGMRLSKEERNSSRPSDFIFLLALCCCVNYSPGCLFAFMFVFASFLWFCLDESVYCFLITSTHVWRSFTHPLSISTILYSTSSVMFIVRVSCYEYPMLFFHWLHIWTLCKGKIRLRLTDRYNHLNDVYIYNRRQAEVQWGFILFGIRFKKPCRIISSIPCFDFVP